MNNFYEQLKSKVDNKLVEALESAKRKLILLQKRKADANNQLDSLKEQKEKLTSLKDASIGDSVAAFEKFTVSLKKINSQIEALSEAVETLSAKIIPQAQKEVERTSVELRESLHALCVIQAKDVTDEMNGLLNRLVEFHDTQYGATRKIYADYGFIPGLFDDKVYASASHRRAEFKVLPLSGAAIAAMTQKTGQVEQSAPATKPPAAPAVKPTRPEKITVLTGVTTPENQAKQWAENVFKPTPDSTPLEILNPDEDKGEIVSETVPEPTPIEFIEHNEGGESVSGPAAAAGADENKAEVVEPTIEAAESEAV